MKSNFLIPLVLAGFVVPSIGTATADDSMAPASSKCSVDKSQAAAGEDQKATSQAGASLQTAPAAGPSDQNAPAAGPSDQTAPAAGPSDQTAPAAGPSDQTAPAAGPSDQTAPAAGPSDQNAPAAGPSDQNAAPQGPSDQSSQAPAAGPQADADMSAIVFLKKANKKEMALAELALTKSKDSSVITFATTLLKDHKENLTKLQHLIKKLNLEKTPVSAEKDINEEKSLLEATDKKKFDQAFVHAMAMDHKDALDQLESLTAAVSNPELKKFLEKTKDTIKGHYTLSKNLEKTFKSNN